MSGSELSGVAKVIANPTSADVLDALMSDRRLSVSAVAAEIGRARSTVSAAVGALSDAGLVARQAHGRTTIVRLAGSEVADALEALGRLSAPSAPVGLRAVNQMQALRAARTCYDHLAGKLGVSLADRLLTRGVLSAAADGSWQLSDRGRDHLIDLGVESALVNGSTGRPLVRACLDWTEHRPHVAGRLGAAICTLWLQDGMVRRLRGSRAVQMTPAAQDWLARI